ncbi:ras guanine nucleotide exchange factor R isoform X1 [Hydra vulgaris]|nr:ras guanine nucleotide exchange factor R [Hydra vulgaris]
MKEKKIEMDELHTWHEVPAISYYFHVFKESFDLIDFEIEDFEESLLADGSENISSFIPDLVVRLLRGFYKTKDGLQITLENYNHYLKDLLDFHYKKKQNIDNPVEKKDFKYLNAKIKVEVLLSMCNWRLELEDAMELTKNIDSDHMRIDPIGTDVDGNVYWYFYGTRLYKESNFPKMESESIKTNHTTPTKTKSGRPVRKKAKIDATKNCKNKQPDLNNCIDTLSSTNKTWSLHCSTLQDWDDFLKELQSKKNKKEKELLDAIVVLDVTIKKLFKEKEALYNRKMLLMAPRRCSDRITMKMKIREEEEKIQEEERLLKSLQKAKELDEKHKQEKEERLKERNRRILEREKLLEERALRVKQREELKLNLDNPDLLHSTRITDSVSSSNKKVVYSDESDSEQNEMLYSMERVVHAMLDHNDSWPFKDPVEEEDAPKYYTYIKHPMDLNTIAEKIRKKVYQQKSEFENDVHLIFDNCEIYNGTTNSFTKMAMKLKNVFLKHMKKEFPPELDDDDDNFFISDERTPKSNRTKNKKSINSMTQEQKKVITPVTATYLINALSTGLSSKLVQSGLKTATICQDSKPFTNGLNSSTNAMHQETGGVTRHTVYLNQNNDSLLMNPLHQLADTALAPLQANSKVVSINTLLKSNSHPYNLVPVKQQIGDLTPRISTESATVRGRPRKALVVTTTTASKNSSVSLQSPQSDSNNVSKSHPTTITWNDLKRQLMLQMKSAGVNIAADSPRWEQVKEQIMTQMNGLGGNIPKVIFTQPSQQLIKPSPIINNITSTPSGQMLLFSNVVKSREVITPATPPIDRSTFPILTQIDHVAQPSHSKVESWLNSTREFIGKDSESATSSPQSFHTSLPIMSSMSNPVRLLPDSSSFLRNPFVNPVDNLRTNNNGHSLPASIKSINDLQKAAQQVVAINQISSKLQEHLGKPVDLKFATSAVTSRELRISSPSFNQTSNGLDLKKQLKNIATAKSEINVWNPQDISVVNQLIEKKVTKSLPIVFHPLGHHLSTTSSTLIGSSALSNASFITTTTRQSVVSKSLSVFSSHLNTNIFETANVMPVSRNISLSQAQEANNSHHIFTNSPQHFTPKINKTPVLIAPLSTGQLRLNINATNFIKSPNNDQVALSSTSNHSFMPRVSSNNIGTNNNPLKKSEGIPQTNILLTTNSSVGVFPRSQNVSLISNTSTVNDSHHLLNGVSKYDSSTAKSFIKLAPT